MKIPKFWRKSALIIYYVKIDGKKVDEFVFCLN